MKKSNPAKLTVRREALRALNAIELTRIVGGETDTLWTGRVMCPAPTLKPAGV